MAAEKGGELPIGDDWETGRQGWEILSLSSEGKVNGRVSGEMMWVEAESVQEGMDQHQTEPKSWKEAVANGQSTWDLVSSWVEGYVELGILAVTWGGEVKFLCMDLLPRSAEASRADGLADDRIGTHPAGAICKGIVRQVGER